MKKCLFLSFLLILTLNFAACGSHQEDGLTIYTNEMKSFYENVETTSASMNDIDINNPESKTIMLSYLDDMNSYFSDLKSIEIPEEYSKTSSNVTNAYSYMNQANNLYHQALETDPADTDLLYTAKSYYDSAMECVQNIGQILAEEKQ